MTDPKTQEQDGPVPGKGSLRDRFAEIALSDAMSANRTTDALREALVSALVKKASDMTPEEIFDSIERIEKMDSISRHEKMVSLLERDG